MSNSLKTEVRRSEITSEQATGELISFVGNASDTSRSKIQHLIEELKGLQQRMEDEGNRVRKQIEEFASLNQSAIDLTKVVAQAAPSEKEVRTRAVET